MLRSRVRWRRALAVWSAGCALFLLCLLPRAQAQSFQARLFDEQDGLTSLSINDIAQDFSGNLWVATDNGLFEYSGSNFEEFNRDDGFNEPAVTSLLVDRSGVVWAGTHTGLFWFDGRKFHEAQYRGQSLVIGINTMLAAKPSGELVIQTAKGTFSAVRNPIREQWQVELYGERHPDFPRGPDMNGVGITASGQLAIGCDEAICVGRQRLGPQQGVPPDYYVSFFTTRDGSLWARGRKHILLWQPGLPGIRDLSIGFPPGGMHTVSRRFTEDANGRILTPTAEGFATWDGHGWTETRSTNKGSLHSATKVFCDREGAIWIGTAGEGLLQSLGYRQWANYSIEDGLTSPSIMALAADRQGRIWVGNDLAANLIEPGSPRIAFTPLASSEDAINTAALAPTPDGGMWTGGAMGQMVHTDAHGRADLRASIDAYMEAMQLDGDGTLWAGTSTGLYALRCTPGNPCIPTQLQGNSLAGRAIHDLVSDGSGGLWVTSEQGLDHLQHGGLTHIQVAGVHQNFRRIVPADANDLWLAGVAPGLIRVHIHYTEGTVVERHTRYELLSDRIQFLSLDHKHRLWIGTDHGVDVLAHGRVTGINTEDGLSWNNAITFLEDRDGSVWIGTTHGLSHLLHPDGVLERPAFRAAINASFYGSSDLMRTTTVHWGTEESYFRFSAPTFRENHSLIYHYQLVGFENSSISTPASSVRFPKLPPGSYTFRVFAEDPIHHVFSTPAELHFTVVPPWQKTRAVKILMVLLCFAALNLVWHLSHRVMVAQQTKLARMVQERTREIELLSMRDALTGVLNRRAIMGRLDEEVEYARRHGTALCIALLDLDHFKQINDTYGHLAGDEVLREAARRLALCVRGSDAIGRYGGEEFIILFRNAEQEFGRQHCERIRNCLAADPVIWDGSSLSVTCSVGLVWSRKPSDCNTGLLAQADHAMYQAKQNGRNRVEYTFLEEEPAGVLAYS